MSASQISTKFVVHGLIDGSFRLTKDSKRFRILSGPIRLYTIRYIQWSKGACRRLQMICVRMSGEHENKVL
jgi:hypothetical protein